MFISFIYGGVGDIDGYVRNVRIKFLEIYSDGGCGVYIDKNVLGHSWGILDSNANGLLPSAKGCCPYFLYGIGYGDENNISGRVTDDGHLKGMALLINAFKDQKICDFYIDVYNVGTASPVMYVRQFLVKR